MNTDSNSGLIKPIIGSVGVGVGVVAILYRAFKSTVKLDQYKAQLPFDNATLSALINENGNLSENEHVLNNICEDGEYTCVMPPSENAGLDFLATSLRTIDFNTARIVVVCDVENQATKVLKELGKRSIGCLLVNMASKAIDSGILLWNDGLINAVMVVSDGMLKHLSKTGNIKVNFLVHYTQKLPHILQQRSQLLIPQAVEGTKVLVIKPKSDNQVQHKTGERKIETPDARKQTIPTERAAQKIQTSSDFFSYISRFTCNLKTVLYPEFSKIRIKEVNAPHVSDEARTADTLSKLGETQSTAPDPTIPQSKIEKVNMLSGLDGLDGLDCTGSRGPYTYLHYETFTWSRTAQSPCYSANDVPHYDSYLKERLRRLKIGQTRAKRVQRYVWPHAASGGSMCVVGNENTGKTWSYLPTVCQHILVKLPPRLLNDFDCGPNCIILCKDEKQGDDIAKLCTDMTGTESVRLKHVVKALTRNSIDEAAISMRKPCGALITTVEHLQQLYLLHSEKNRIFNLDSLKCVTFDGIDSIWRGGRIYCQKIIKWLLDALSFKKGNSQLFIVGRLWIDMFMKPLIKELPDLLLVFEDELEAALFAGIDFEFIVSNNYRNDIVQILAEKKMIKRRVVLVCSGYTDINELSEYLSSKNIDNTAIEQFDEQADELYNNWCTNRMCPVLVVAENSIAKCHGGYIDFLVHYGYSSWPLYKGQYRLFYNNYRCGVGTFPGTSVVVMHPNELERAWLTCDFLLKHNRYPPENILTMLTECQIDVKGFQPRSDRPLCHMFKSYGNCIRRSCQYRHFLFDYETQPRSDPISKGTIKFYVLSSVNPAKTAVRLVEKGFLKYYQNIPVSEFGDRLHLHYESLINLPQCTNPQIADVCVMKINELYQRVAITQLVSADRIEVKQLDSGVEYLMVTKDELLICNEEFKDVPFEAYDLRITGLTPFNMERLWPADAIKLVRHKFFNIPAHQHRIYTADVQFDFHDIVFVENIYNSNGEDLKSFIAADIPMYMDNGVHRRLMKMISLAKPSEKGN